MSDLVLGAIFSGSRLVSAPHPIQHGLFTLRKSWHQAADRMVSKAKNRKTHSRLRHSFSKLSWFYRLVGVILEDLFGKEVLDLGLIVHHLQVGRLQQLCPAIAQLLPDRLLHPRVVEVALSGRIARE